MTPYTSTYLKITFTTCNNMKKRLRLNAERTVRGRKYSPFGKASSIGKGVAYISNGKIEYALLSREYREIFEFGYEFVEREDFLQILKTIFIKTCK